MLLQKVGREWLKVKLSGIMKHEAFIKILNKELVPALGCTDPIGVAFAAAYAKKYAKGELQSITAELSANIIKNAAAVCIPKTEGKCGVALALALGALGGDSDKGLEVLSDITKENVKQAEACIEKGLIQTTVSENAKKLFMKINMKSKDTEVLVTVEDNYLDITSIIVNGEIIFCKEHKNHVAENEISYDMLSLESILEFAETAPICKLDIIEQAIKTNMHIATEGFSKDYGVAIGKNIKALVETGIMSEDLANVAMMWTAAATDARMAGCDFPVISNTGSGNQGLASTIPVISIAKKLNTDYEKMVRAVTISSLVTIYIKEKLGTLSPVCGAVIAGVGTSCGVVYLLDGKKENMEFALQNTLGDITGMLCDGAKAGCALKVATCTNTGVMSALMAMKNIRIQGTDGIVGNGEMQTIDNFIKIATDGMHKMDRVILDIILKKEDMDVSIRQNN